MANSYDAPIVDSGYNSDIIELVSGGEGHDTLPPSSNFEHNLPQPVPAPEQPNIKGGIGAGGETPFTPILKPEEVKILDEFTAPTSQLVEEVIQARSF